MDLEELILKVNNEGVFVDTHTFLPLNQTNIPKDLGFRYNEPIFWKVKIKKFDSLTREVDVLINNYDYNEPQLFNNQINNLEIKFVDFGMFDWTFFKDLLIHYKIIEFKHLLINYEETVYSGPFYNTDELWTKPAIAQISNKEKDKLSIINKKVYNILINFQLFRFENGKVSFEENNLFKRPIRFEIENNFILEEFDLIKNWFSKALKKNSISVTITCSFDKDNFAENIEVTSIDIDRITKDLIEGIKFQNFKSYVNKQKDHLNGIVYDTESLKESVLQKNNLNLSNEDILDIFVSNENIRNRKQLEYLAELKQSTNSKIRFTPKAPFGFLFCIEQKSNTYIVWELINSHATYIWEFNNEIFPNYLDVLIKQIEIIHVAGRQHYKESLKKDSISSGFSFKVITHEKLNFEYWRKELEFFLTD